MSAHDNMINALLFVFSLNLIMWFAGYGIADVGGTNPFSYGDNLLTEFNTGNESSFDVPTNVSDRLPTGAATGIDPDTGNVYTDIFTSIRTWFVDATGLGWVLGILSGPKVILTAMGMPTALAWAITALWYGISLVIVIAFMWGR